MAKRLPSDGPKLRSSAEREERTRAMTDAELLDHLGHDGHPDIEDDLWRPVLEAEAKRRGLRS
jgi:hypothetical protein